MYIGVPTQVLAILEVSLKNLAKPKSHILNDPSWTSMFAGLRSR